MFCLPWQAHKLRTIRWGTISNYRQVQAWGAGYLTSNFAEKILVDGDIDGKLDDDLGDGVTNAVP